MKEKLLNKIETIVAKGEMADYKFCKLPEQMILLSLTESFNAFA